MQKHKHVFKKSSLAMTLTGTQQHKLFKMLFVLLINLGTADPVSQHNGQQYTRQLLTFKPHSYLLDIQEVDRVP